MNQFYKAWTEMIDMQEGVLILVTICAFVWVILWADIKKSEHRWDDPIKKTLENSREYAFWLGLFALIGLCLRLYKLTSSPIWYDEGFSLLIARLPLQELIQATALDVHPPLFYLVIKPFASWMEFARVVPVVFSMVSLYLTYLICERLHMGRTATVVAVALMALSPVQIHYAREIRMYSLLQLLVMLQFLAILDIDKKWWLFGLATVGTLYTHNYGLIYTAVTAVISVIRELEKTKRSTVTTGVVMLCGAAFLPWVTNAMLGQIEYVTVSGNHWMEPLRFVNVVTALFKLVSGNELTSYLILAGALISLVIWFYMVPIAWINGKQILLLWSYLPIVITILISLWRPILLDRAWIACLPGLFMLVGLAWQTGRPYRKVVGTIALLVVFVPALGHQITTIDQGKEKCATCIDVRQVHGSVVVHLEDTTLIPATVYGYTQNYLLEPCKEDRAALGPDLRRMLGIQTVSVEEMTRNGYVFVGVVGPLSSKCHLDQMADITKGRKQLQSYRSDYVVAGEWSNAE